MFYTHAIITFQDKFHALALEFSNDQIRLDGHLLIICKKPLDIIKREDMIRYTQLVETEEFNETSLYIGNLPPSADEDQLKHILRGFGKIVDVKIKKANRGKAFAFITFAKVISAYTLLQCSQRKSYNYDGCELVINTVTNTVN